MFTSIIFKVLEISEKSKKVMRQKVSFLAISGHFGAFLTLFEPLGTQSEFFKNLKILFLQYYEIKPSCKISENSNVWFFLKAPDERTNERTEGNEFVGPFPSFVGGPKMQNM